METKEKKIVDDADGKGGGKDNGKDDGDDDDNINLIDKRGPDKKTTPYLQASFRRLIAGTQRQRDWQSRICFC